MGTKWQATIKTLIKPTHPLPRVPLVGDNKYSWKRETFNELAPAVSKCMQDWSYVKFSEEKCEWGLSFSSSNTVYCRSTVFLYNKQKWERDNRTAPFYSHKDWKDFNRLIVNRVPISTCAFDFNNHTATIEHMKLELDFKVIHVSGEFSWRPHAVMDNSSLNCTYKKSLNYNPRCIHLCFN